MTQHKTTCPEYWQKPNANNKGCVVDTDFPCNCKEDTMFAQSSTAQFKENPKSETQENKMTVDQYEKLDEKQKETAQKEAKQAVLINKHLAELVKEGINLYDFGGGNYLAPSPVDLNFTGPEHQTYVLTFEN